MGSWSVGGAVGLRLCPLMVWGVAGSLIRAVPESMV